ncbi:sulfotransferase domain-containing protein [Candidatus Kaiserbacteria bacterium]|nr:sulfotransferase domain-containing protein [Candidatus Kaiserbacteria bacterium]
MNTEIKPSVDFIGIGAARSASTWIFDCLKEHPALCGASPKETKFFLERGHAIAEYGKYYRDCPSGKLKGEFTPGYLYSAYAAETIRREYPMVKLIVCLRNPIERLISTTYHELMREGSDPSRVSDVAESVFASYPENEDATLIRGKYFKALQTYLALFPREQMHISFYEDIAKDPRAFMKELYMFLDVDSSFVPSVLEKKINITAENERYSLTLNRAYYSARDLLSKSVPGRLVKRILIAMGIKRAMKSLQKKNIRHEHLTPLAKKPMSNQKRIALRNYYDEDIRSLEKYMGRSLEDWR